MGQLLTSHFLCVGALNVHLKSWYSPVRLKHTLPSIFAEFWEIPQE